MEQRPQALQVDARVVCREIEALIQATMARLMRDGAVIGLSGGLDSATAAMLTMRSVGIEKVHLINLPERDSNPIHREHAKRLAEQLGARLIVKPVTPILKAGCGRRQPHGVAHRNFFPMGDRPLRGRHALVAPVPQPGRADRRIYWCARIYPEESRRS